MSKAKAAHYVLGKTGWDKIDLKEGTASNAYTYIFFPKSESVDVSRALPDGTILAATVNYDDGSVLKYNYNQHKHRNYHTVIADGTKR